MKRLLIGLAAAGLLQTIAWSEPATEDQKRIEGTWLAVDAELAGQKFPDNVLKQIKITLKDSKYSARVGKMLDQGAYRLDPAAKPRAIDVIGGEGPNKGKTFLSIYELTGDTLRICYDLEGKKRPTAFKTEKNTRQFLITYKREKP